MIRPERLVVSVSSWRQVVEEDALADPFRVVEIDRQDLDEGEVVFVILGGPDLAGDGVAGGHAEALDLGWRDVNVVRSGEIVVVGVAQEAIAVLQYLQHALGEDEAALLRLRLHDLEDQLLLAQRGVAGDAERLGRCDQRLVVHLVKRVEIDRLFANLLIRRGRLFGYRLLIRLLAVFDRCAAVAAPGRLAVGAAGASLATGLFFSHGLSWERYLSKAKGFSFSGCEGLLRPERTSNIPPAELFVYRTSDSRQRSVAGALDTIEGSERSRLMPPISSTSHPSPSARCPVAAPWRVSYRERQPFPMGWHGTARAAACSIRRERSHRRRPG